MARPVQHVAAGLRSAARHPTWDCSAYREASDTGKPPAQARAPAAGYLKPEEGLGARRRNAAMNERVEPAALAEGRPLSTLVPAAGGCRPTIRRSRWGRIGVLLMNLGTPEGTDYWPMRRYLKEFLSDRRVIEVSRLIWWPLLNLIILTKRPGRKGRDYASIWNKERNEGPLKTITRAQAEDAGGASPAIAATASWSTGRCATATRRSRERHPGAARPGLRPHPAGAALSAICRRDLGDRLRPGLPRPDGHALAAGRARRAALSRRPGLYRGARGDSMRTELAKLDFEPEVILVSFHGVPQELPAQGRPLSLPVREDVAAAARGLRLAGRALPPDASSRASATRNGCSPTRTRP